MWQDKVKEIIDILENSNVNEIEVTFWGRKVRVVKNAAGIVANHTQAEVSHSNVIDSSIKEESVNETQEDLSNGEKYYLLCLACFTVLNPQISLLL